MNIEISLLISVITAALSTAGFIISRIMQARNDGQKAGEMLSEVKQTRELVDEIKKDLSIANLPGMQNNISQLQATVKQLHRRLENHITGKHSR